MGGYGGNYGMDGGGAGGFMGGEPEVKSSEKKVRGRQFTSELTFLTFLSLFYRKWEIASH